MMASAFSTISQEKRPTAACRGESNSCFSDSPLGAPDLRPKPTDVFNGSRHRAEGSLCNQGQNSGDPYWVSCKELDAGRNEVETFTDPIRGRLPSVVSMDLVVLERVRSQTSRAVHAG
jgi:hypothetical protein